MNITFEQAVAAHKDGRFKEAEFFYRSIIAKQPTNFEAYNNLGLLLLSLHKLDEAVTSFRKAIVFRPDNAETHYNLGVALYKFKKLEEAETSYRNAIKLRPEISVVHNNLGATLKKLGRSNDAVISYKKAIELKPDYAEAYNNLGVALHHLYIFDESELSYRKAIELKPDLADAHYNLGLTLNKLEKLDEAELILKKAIEFRPNYAEAYLAMGNTLYKLKKFEEAKISFNKAIELKPDYAEAHNNLGVLLNKLGKLVEAEASHKKATKFNPNSLEFLLNLSSVQDYLNNTDSSSQKLLKILSKDSNSWGLIAGVKLAIFKFLMGDFKKSKKYLLASSKIDKKTNLKFRNYKIFYNYLQKLLNWHENRSLKKLVTVNHKKLYVIGESHALVSHGLNIITSRGNFLCKSFLIYGCKQWDLGNCFKNEKKIKFERIISSIPKYSEILLSFGEIDCRLNSGIIKHNNEYPQKKKIDLINVTVKNYLNYIYKINSTYKHKITLQGVPCPNINKQNINSEEVIELINLIREFNLVLKRKSTKIGFGFLDVYKLTNNGDGISNKIWHIDTNHLTPEGMLEVWSTHS